jgi:hypothetical protein
MLNKCVVEPVTLGEVLSLKYDLSLGTVGFEKRSRFLFSEHSIESACRIASAFEDRNVLSFEDNLAFFRGAGFKVETHNLQEFAEFFLRSLRKADESPKLEANDAVRVCVDISTMSRSRMAAIFEVLLNSDWQHEVAVDFVYSIAKYCDPPSAPTFIVSAQPISNSFSGWSVAPDASTCAVFGVGYEPDQVIGTIEYLEPGFVWAFVPDGPDPRFAQAVEKVNQPLWLDIPSECVVRYKIDEPFNTFVSLESIVYSLSRKHRPILIPFGPKIFTIQCLLAAVIHSPAVAVWRISGGESTDPEDREAAGQVYALRAIFSVSGPPDKSNSETPAV